MENPNLNEIHDFLVSLAFKAGDIINSALPETTGTGSKMNSADLVTEYDRAVENMISTSLREKYPHYEFHGEETYDPARPLTDAPTFVVDPIDGTTNFVHGFPFACVSLGFAVGRIPTVGVVYNPSTKTLHSAIRGQGAFLNRETRLPLKGDNVEPLSGLANALIAIEWGADRSGNNWETKVRTYEKLGQSKENGGAMVRAMRSLGSAALNLCAVADGSLDLYWEGGCWSWDVCAGWVILSEAGGIMADGNPGAWEARLDGRKYLAVRGSPGGIGQKEMVEEFWSYVQGDLKY
ncbi:Inositol monophosphatase, putative [Penicillium digitatum]|uniref:Inositol-1-monophosphatase n=3 Tax=Penicillium digitatum TaxID=36651 RepID=K9G5P0_PEND2|nr:Inositol monophosphatase, putative [Penicillium digitatum Pd1]EKV08505.1 Inositol monophosphatase, putative [Penicillium digitatum Pd1]EKV10158.1 Inositol monophosphatase, putative [Penicillium digitatum PHI26]QQK41777.1 Inositol monophosphatase, putative [Penicillium digitatum]